MSNKLRGEYYMKQLEERCTICTTLTKPEVQLFELVKEHYGQRTNASAVRMLILREARAILRSQHHATKTF